MATKLTCPNCGGGEFKRRVTTYPLVLPGRLMHVGRVKVQQCSSCDHLVPTPEGREKLLRSLSMFGQMLSQAGRSDDGLAASNLEHSRPADVPEGPNPATVALRRFRGRR